MWFSASSRAMVVVGALSATLTISDVMKSAAVPPCCFTKSLASCSGLETSRSHHERCRSPRKPACCSRSPSLTMPTDLPLSSTTGTPEFLLSIKTWAMSATVVSGGIVTTFVVMMSFASMILTFQLSTSGTVRRLLPSPRPQVYMAFVWRRNMPCDKTRKMRRRVLTQY
jgi:hypothetical protein